MSSAEGVSFERRRREDRGAEGDRVWAPSPENFSIFELKKTTFRAFWVLFLQLNGNWLGHRVACNNLIYMISNIKPWANVGSNNAQYETSSN